MGATANDAKQQLLRAIERGIQTPKPHPQAGAQRAKARNSAVLVLFGALDSVLAAGGEGSGLDDPSRTPLPAELDVLLTRRSNGMRNHAGQIAFPGGGVETSDANRAATALREAWEETGLDPTGVDILGQLDDAHIPVSNYVVTPVIGWWRLPSEVAADHQESVEVFRAPVAELVEPAARGTFEFRQGNGVFRGPAFQLGPQFEGRIIWGFTAILLSSIFDAVGWAKPWDRDRIFHIPDSR